MSLGALVSWICRSPKPCTVRQPPAHLRDLRPGDYAGTAVYRPRDRRDLRPDLYAAIGKTFHLTYTCLAEQDDPFAGQMLFQEKKAGVLRSWLPEQDLEFVAVAQRAAVPASSPTVRTPAATAGDQRPPVARAS